MNTHHRKQEYTGLELAVIGMSCRLPGANNLEKFWENLKNGVESMQFFTEREFELSEFDRNLWDKPNFIPATGTVDNPEYFDAAFFGYKPLEAEFLDPQIRLFYECCWEALEASGYNPESYEGLIGIYAGATNNRGWEYPGMTDERTRILGSFARDHLIDRDFLSTRIAYKLDLRGPAITMKTACSTGLVAVDMACRALLTGQCEIALAGATSLAANTIRGYFYSEGMITSQDGHVRSFDAKSQGVVFSEGVGVVALKRLRTALKDNDTILAVIKGTAVNNDGSRKGSYESPCTEGQEEAIRRAIHMAEIESESITYVETHGTGTVIGDPIEIEGLKGAFNTDRKAYCAIGSVKSNFGHTDTAAGISGFIKTVLSLQHRMIPPSLHFENPNPKIDFANSPFYVNTSLQEWKNDTYPLRAGVSSFGVGGTNAHVVLEEAPEPVPTSDSRRWQLLLLSTRTETALEKATENLVNYFQKKPAQPLADAAFTLQVGRKPFKFRKMWVINPSNPEFDIPNMSATRDKNRLIFMFSGQGAQYVNMGLDIYRTERVFREEMERCFKILEPLMECNLKKTLYPSPGTPGAEGDKDINQTEITQPVIFTFEYAMAKLLMHWGLEPYAMIGHSIGEYVAACLSGVFSLEDALKLVAMRGKLMQQIPSGAMMSVTLSEEELMPLLKNHVDLSLAAVNAPNLCVVSGPHQAVETFENQLKEKQIETRSLHTSHAFHSRMMEPILKQFEQAIKEISLNKPRLPYISNLSGQWITVEETLNPGYWVEHLRKTVRFRDGVTPLLNDPSSIFIELGPGRSLATFVQKHEDKKSEHIILNLVKHPKEVSSDDYYLLNKLGQLWLYGVEIEWLRYYADEKRRRVPLPTYPFERQRYWLDRASKSADGKDEKEKQKNLEALMQKNPEMAEWFYVPSWKRKPLPPRESTGELNWLIFTDPQDKSIGRIGALLLEKLKQYHPQDRFIRVETGPTYTSTPSDNSNPVFAINPRQESDYQALITELKKQGRIPQRIIHLWNISAGTAGNPSTSWKEYYQDDEYRGFYSLIFLAKAIGNEGITEKIKIMAVSENMQEVSGEDTLYPTRATLLGPIHIIPVENPNVNCRSIDVILPKPGSPKETKLLEQLALEFRTETKDTVIAYRNHYRWVQSYERIPLTPAEPKLTAETAEIETSSPSINFKNDGVYLITGGLGGIGLELARHITKNVKARLILTARSPMPKREEWHEWLNTHGHLDKTSSRINKILELEAAGTGSEILTASVDTADFQQMAALISEVEKKWGKINGVMHAAGLPGGGVIQLKTPDIAGKVLAPKIQGTLVLDKVLKDHPLEFIILFSSINSIVPTFGQVDYFSANAFLDAYAHYKTAQEGIPTVSINWDTWQEVGMAVEAAKQWSNRAKSARKISHPLFDQWLHDDHELAIFVTHFNLDRHWVLNEHKIAESGKGLIPGVTYLEMTRQALESVTGQFIGNNNKVVEISEVYFLNPLIVGKDENRETHFILRKQPGEQGEAFDFLVQSRQDSKGTHWDKHAVGKVRWVESAGEAPRHAISEITSGWGTEKIEVPHTIPDKQSQESQRGLLAFGPRWRSMREVHIGEKQGLALLNLNEAYTAELEFFKLHPALLDTSTGLLFGHAGKAAYIPFAYKRLIMRSPFKSKIYSLCRVVDEGDTVQKESLKFDVTIMDEEGNELVEVKEFTMLQVSEGVKSKVMDKEISMPSLELPPTQLEKNEEKSPLKNGILPSEGMEAIDRILTRVLGKSGHFPQVVVSTQDLYTRFEHRPVSSTSTREMASITQQEQGTAVGKTTTALHPRPAISSVYVSPKTEIEQKVAQLWQRILGIEQVGINDDFFELGGDSLNVVQLNNELKKAFNMDIPVAIMFRHQTIRTFTQYLQQNTGAAASVPQPEDRSDELAKSKDRLKARMQRR